jgi:hypothetical protein
MLVLVVTIIIPILVYYCLCLEKMIRLGSDKLESKIDSLTRNESPTISTLSTDTESSVPMCLEPNATSGILKQASAQSNSIRIDRGGTVIVSGSKSHRICFADEVSGTPRAIAEVHQVESLKTFNFGNRFVNGENSCVCTIS